MVTNPAGTETGSGRVLRGGSWFIGAARRRLHRDHAAANPPRSAKAKLRPVIAPPDVPQIVFCVLCAVFTHSPTY